MDQEHIAAIWPLNHLRSRVSEGTVKQSRTLFAGQKILIPVTNASIGEIQVTTPCTICPYPDFPPPPQSVLVLSLFSTRSSPICIRSLSLFPLVAPPLIFPILHFFSVAPKEVLYLCDVFAVVPGNSPKHSRGSNSDSEPTDFTLHALKSNPGTPGQLSKVTFRCPSKEAYQIWSQQIHHQMQSKLTSFPGSPERRSLGMRLE